MQPQANYTVSQDLIDYLAGQANEVTGDQSLLLARAEDYVDQIAAGRPMVTPATDTVHVLVVTGNPTGGTFTLSVTFNGVMYTTAALPFNATNSAIAAAFSAIPGFPGSVAVMGGPLPYAPMYVGYRGGMGAQYVPAGSAASSLTGGVTPSVSFLLSGAGGGLRRRFNLSGMMAGEIESIKNAVCAQAEYMLQMDNKLFIEPQYDSIKGPDFSTTGKLPVISPKARRELGLAGLLYSTARSRP